MAKEDHRRRQSAWGATECAIIARGCPSRVERAAASSAMNCLFMGWVTRSLGATEGVGGAVVGRDSLSARQRLRARQRCNGPSCVPFIAALSKKDRRRGRVRRLDERREGMRSQSSPAHEHVAPGRNVVQKDRVRQRSFPTEGDGVLPWFRGGGAGRG